MSVQELETAVTKLPKEELVRFTQWFEEYISDEWDRRIEADSLAGRFDAAGKRAKADHEAGRCTPLRDTPVTLLSPTEPVVEADWEAAQ